MNEASLDADANDLFEQALALPPGERREFLDRHCDDVSEVEEILKRIDDALMDTNTIYLAPTDPVVSDKQRKVHRSRSTREFAAPSIAGYEIEDQLGHGGMGVVYRARHQDTSRTVALKSSAPGPLRAYSARGTGRGDRPVSQRSPGGRASGAHQYRHRL